MDLMIKSNQSKGGGDEEDQKYHPFILAGRRAGSGI
jgi:hypothetical protein